MLTLAFYIMLTSPLSLFPLSAVSLENGAATSCYLLGGVGSHGWVVTHVHETCKNMYTSPEVGRGERQLDITRKGQCVTSSSIPDEITPQELRIQIVYDHTTSGNAKKIVQCPFKEIFPLRCISCSRIFSTLSPLISCNISLVFLRWVTDWKVELMLW